jgi:hypothetical protein
MNRPIFFLTLLASMLVLAVSPPATAEVNPASLASGIWQPKAAAT